MGNKINLRRLGSIGVSMFSFHMSYVPLLQAVAHRYCLSYASVIHQQLDDGGQIYGVEVQLPPQPPHRPSSTTLFFWAATGLEENAAYESAAFQALIVLQAVLGFVIVDYSIHGLLLYRALA